MRTESPEEQKQREAFEAAEKAYRSAFTEIGRLSLAGGAEEPSTVLRDTTTGDYLNGQMDQLRWLKQNDSHTSSAGMLGWVKAGSYSANQVTLDSCEDYRRVLVVDQSGKSTKPDNAGTRVYRQRLTIDLAQNRWKVSKVDTVAQLEECGR